MKIKNHFYGMKITDPLNFRLTKYQDFTLFRKEYMGKLKLVVFNNEPLNSIKDYFHYISNDTFEGRLVYDTLLLLLDEKYSEDLINLLKEYFKKNKKAKNTREIKKIIKKLSQKDNIREPSLAFTSPLTPYRFDTNILIILPDVPWLKEVYSEEGGDYTVGTENFFATMKIVKADYHPDHNFINHHLYLNIIKTGPGISDEVKVLNIVKSGEMKRIVNNKILLGRREFNEIHECITVSNYKNLRLYINITRYYLNENDIYKISLQSIIKKTHILADVENLIIRQSALLDTVMFDNKTVDD